MIFSPGEKVHIANNDSPYGVATFKGTAIVPVIQADDSGNEVHVMEKRWLFQFTTGMECYCTEGALKWVERLEINQDII